MTNVQRSSLIMCNWVYGGRNVDEQLYGQTSKKVIQCENYVNMVVDEDGFNVGAERFCEMHMKKSKYCYCMRKAVNGSTMCFEHGSNRRSDLVAQKSDNCLLMQFSDKIIDTRQNCIDSQLNYDCLYVISKFIDDKHTRLIFNQLFGIEMSSLEDETFEVITFNDTHIPSDLNGNQYVHPNKDGQLFLDDDTEHYLSECIEYHTVDFSLSDLVLSNNSPYDYLLCLDLLTNHLTKLDISTLNGIFQEFHIPESLIYKLIKKYRFEDTVSFLKTNIFFFVFII